MQQITQRTLGILVAATKPESATFTGNSVSDNVTSNHFRTFRDAVVLTANRPLYDQTPFLL